MSAVITFTSIGNEWLKKANLHIEQKPFDVVAELQIKKASKRTLITKILMKELKKKVQQSMMCMLYSCCIIN